MWKIFDNIHYVSFLLTNYKLASIIHIISIYLYRISEVL